MGMEDLCNTETHYPVPSPYYVIGKPRLACRTWVLISISKPPPSGFGQPQFFNCKRTSDRTIVMSSQDKEEVSPAFQS